MAPPHLQCKLNTQEQWTTSSPLMNNQTGKLLLFVSFKTKNLKSFKDVGWVDKKNCCCSVWSVCRMSVLCKVAILVEKSPRSEGQQWFHSAVCEKTRQVKLRCTVPASEEHPLRMYSCPSPVYSVSVSIHTEQRWTCEWQMQYVTNCMLSVSHNC